MYNVHCILLFLSGTTASSVITSQMTSRIATPSTMGRSLAPTPFTGDTPSMFQSISGGAGPEGTSMFVLSVQPELTMYSTRVGMGGWEGRGGGRATWKTKEEDKTIDPHVPNSHPVLKVIHLYCTYTCTCHVRIYGNSPFFSF